MCCSRADDPKTALASPPSRLTATNVAISVAVAIVLFLPALIRRKDLNSDEATMAVVARMMRHGATLYSGAVDRKAPGVFVLFRVLETVFGSWSITAARWVLLATIITSAWLLAVEAVRRWPQVSALSVALITIAAFAVLPAEDSRAVTFEALATLPAVGAFVLGARRRTVLAAIALGVAALFKQTLLLGALPLAVQCLVIPASLPRRLRRLAVAGAVTAVTVLIGLLPFGLRLALDWYGGSDDNYLGGTTIGEILGIGGAQVGEVLAMTLWLMMLIGVAWWGRFRRVPLDLALWTLAGVVAAALGFRFLFHYFNQLLPALVLLAAPSLTGRAMFRGIWQKVAMVFLAGALVFSMITVLFPQGFHQLPDV